MRARVIPCVVILCSVASIGAGAVPAGAAAPGADPASKPATAPVPGPSAGAAEALSPQVAPKLLQYQGRFTDPSGTPLAGSVKLTFRLFNAPVAGSVLWTETHTDVALNDGVASVLLGSLVSFSGDAFTAESRYLGITVNDGTELLPRLVVTSVPFALQAESLQGKTPADFEPEGSVSALSINDGSPPNQGSNRVHWNNLTGVPEGFADGTDQGVTDHGQLAGLLDDDHPQYALRTDLAQSDSLGPNTGRNLVSWYNLTDVPAGFADGADNQGAGITDHGQLTGLLDDDHPQYALDTDLEAHVKAADPHPVYATDQDLADHAADPGAHHTKTVSASELTAGTLDPARLPAGGITGAHVQDGSLTGADLADGTVGYAKLAPGSVTGTIVADGTLTGEDLASGTVDSTRLAVGAVTGSRVKDGSLRAVDMLDGPGAAYLGDPDVRSLTDQALTLLTKTITCPVAGWVLAVGSGQACIEAGGSGLEHPLEFSVSAENDTLDPLARAEYRIYGFNSIRQCAPVVSQRLFPVTAGENAFYIVGLGEAGTTMEVSRLNLTLVFVARQY
jgi:hypothetical protein